MMNLRVVLLFSSGILLLGLLPTLVDGVNSDRENINGNGNDEVIASSPTTSEKLRSGVSSVRKLKLRNDEENDIKEDNNGNDNDNDNDMQGGRNLRRSPPGVTIDSNVVEENDQEQHENNDLGSTISENENQDGIDRELRPLGYPSRSYVRPQQQQQQQAYGLNSLLGIRPYTNNNGYIAPPPPRRQPYNGYRGARAPPPKQGKSSKAAKSSKAYGYGSGYNRPVYNKGYFKGAGAGTDEGGFVIGIPAQTDSLAAALGYHRVDPGTPIVFIQTDPGQNIIIDGDIGNIIDGVIVADLPTKPPSPTVSPSPTNPPTTGTPTEQPTRRPTQDPTKRPTPRPTQNPTKNPTRNPTKNPTRRPTGRPTKNPTSRPTKRPSKNPTRRPTKQPTKRPTNNPTKRPTRSPTNNPTKRPTNNPTKNPTNNPTKNPTVSPTAQP